MTSVTTHFSADMARGVALESVTLRPKNSLNDYGEPSYVGAATSYPAYIRRVRIGERSGDQEKDIVEYQVYIFNTTLTVDVEDELIMPGSIKRPIIRVDYRRDEYGQQAVVLSVGR